MKLIIGLGNPETRYNGTRHNVGFCILDNAAAVFGSHFLPKPKFKAEIAEVTLGTQKILLVKPTTYYNTSGEAVRSLIDFYHLEPKDCLVVHDELALPIGTLRTRIGGGSAGNNGVKSITKHVGDATVRLRIGIYSAGRDRMDDADFVLGKLTSDEKGIIDTLQHIALAAIEDFAYDQLHATTHLAE